MIARNIRGSIIHFDSGGNIERQSFYLGEHGKQVTEVILTSVASINLVEAHCRNLVSITCQGMTLFSELRGVLVKSPALREFHCRDSEGNLDPVFDAMCMPNLHTLSITNQRAFWRASDDIEPAIKSAGGKLSRLEVSHILRGDIFRVENLFEHCPLLTSLGLLTVRVGIETFTTLVSKCPQIVQLSLRGCIDTTDDAIRMLVRSLPLRVLNIEKCSKLTAQSLQYIQEYTYQTLQGLYLESEDNFNIQDVTGMLVTCPHMLHLHTLSWTGQGQWGNANNVHTAQLFALSLHRVRNLVLGGPLLTEQILCAVGQNCVNLHTLELRRPVYEEYPAEGIFALMQGCLRLSRVVMQPLATMQNTFVQVVVKQWQALRPTLTVQESRVLSRPVWEVAEDML